MLRQLQIKKFLCSNKALSLVEVMVSMTIMVAVILASHVSFLTGDACFRSNEAKVTATQSARTAMDNMVRELRAAAPADAPPDISVTETNTEEGNSSEIKFYLGGHDGTFTFYWQDYGDDADQILRILYRDDDEDGTEEKIEERIIGNKISALSFTDHTIEGTPVNAITIDLTATETIPRRDEAGEEIEIDINLKEKINLRLL